MAESPYRQYQDANGDNKHDACIEVDPASISELTCSDCIPNPNAISPNWRTQTEPFLNEKTCNYSIAIITNYNGTGGDELEARLEEYLESGIKALLSYYGKGQSDINVAALKEVAEFADYHVGGDFLIPRPNSYMKALLVVPASDFDSIEAE